LDGADSPRAVSKSADFDGRGTVPSRWAVAALGGALLELDLVAAAGEEDAEVLPVVRSIFGTISAARTSVLAAPIMKYLIEPPEPCRLDTRRGAAIVTLTLGSEETGICEDAFRRSTLGETGETVTGSTPGASFTTCDVAAPADAARCKREELAHPALAHPHRASWREAW